LLTLRNIFVILAAGIGVLAGLSRPAEAQIYAWRDANGVLTVSDRPKDSGVRAVVVPVAPSLSTRSNPVFEPLIQQHAARQGIQPDLVRAVIQVESAFNPRAVSPKGAMGLMQLMPATAARYGVRDPFNPAENIRAGVTYLRQLLDRYDRNEQLALAAYNAGPGAVDKYGSTIPPYRETRNYVHRIKGIRGTIRSAPGTRVFKFIEIVDGRPIAKYTNTKPESGDYEEVGR
jgi:soluble lytic murein transglycosylase-like protein